MYLSRYRLLSWSWVITLLMVTCLWIITIVLLLFTGHSVSVARVSGLVNSNDLVFFSNDNSAWLLYLLLPLSPPFVFYNTMSQPIVCILISHLDSYVWRFHSWDSAHEWWWMDPNHWTYSLGELLHLVPQPFFVCILQSRTDPAALRPLTGFILPPLIALNTLLSVDSPVAPCLSQYCRHHRTCLQFHGKSHWDDARVRMEG